MDMSLDDIIKSKKITQAPSKKFGIKKPATQPLRRTANNPVFKEARRITDARVKIIQKNRAKIRDARDKLAEITRNNGDVRKKLMQKQEYTTYKYSKVGGGSSASSGGGYVGRRTVGVSNKVIPAGGLKTKSSNYKTSSLPVVATRRRENHFEIPRGYVDYDNMEKMEEEEYAAASHLSRTVENDIAYELAPPAPRRLNSWGSASNEHFDPFDVYEVPYSTRHERRMSPDLPSPPPKGILRSTSLRERSPDSYSRRYQPEQQTSQLSYEMRSRLERAPDPHASMGIFSNPIKPSSSSSSSLSMGGGSSSMFTSSTGYRIVVSNLHTSVTQSDIKELFEDIGELYDSRIVRPGVAEVIYKTLDDAEKAVDTYHNRQLDGQPMKCLLVNPRASNNPTAPAMRSSSTHSSNKTPLEIDIDALHKVLFRRH
ncbi:uncharacterized protein LOC135957892 isoform X2 [Calliphora vicina]|uniref:uncharacterized protein LOC135957892 isoform X2 n=1 Tax=Calliphora vicina TaxID=7373 RepID=UPI00325AAEAA